MTRSSDHDETGALIDELRSLVHCGMVSLHYTGDGWDVEWWEIPASPEGVPTADDESASFRRECHVDGDYRDLADALRRAIEMIRTGIPGWSW